MGLNRIVLLGMVAQDPEIRYNTSGLPSTSFTLAVERTYAPEGKTDTDYIRIVTRRNLAERCAETVLRGALITVEGRLYTNSYETRDGHHRKSVEVEAVQIEMVTPAAVNPAGSGPLSIPPLDKIPPPAMPVVTPLGSEPPF